MDSKIIRILEINTFFQNIPNLYLKQLIKFHINNYYKAYSINIKESKKSFLAKYGKGNEKRKILIKKNKNIIKNPTTSPLVASHLELINSILILVANQKKNKLGLLLLNVYFIYKKIIKDSYKNYFLENPILEESLNLFFDYMDFYSFTYFSKNSIVNSLIVILNGLLTTRTNCERTDIANFLTIIQNSLFEKTELPTKVRADYLKKFNVYSVGIYNSLPIFQLYTGENINYYSNRDLLKIKKFLNDRFLDEDVYTKITEISTDDKLSKLNEILTNKFLLSKLINNLHTYYALNPFLDENSEFNFYFPCFFNLRKYSIHSHKNLLNKAFLLRNNSI